jgi:BirA family biotin operon repressor/biotin-[acetyl-CoA-carboxylase] ligase
VTYSSKIELINQSLLTGWLGHKIIYLPTIDSTNTECKRRSLTENEGLVVLSEEQTAGKGQLGRDWVSSKGKGVWMSLLLKPDLPPDKIPPLTLVAAASICTALEAESREFSLQVAVKWPNDILLEGKKAAGILTEMQAGAGKVQSVIVGIGLNVNHNRDDSPPGIMESGNFPFPGHRPCLDTGETDRRHP